LRTSSPVSAPFKFNIHGVGGASDSAGDMPASETQPAQPELSSFSMSGVDESIDTSNMRSLLGSSSLMGTRHVGQAFGGSGFGSKSRSSSSVGGGVGFDFRNETAALLQTLEKVSGRCDAGCQVLLLSGYVGACSD
jgi:hypothetical protein